MFGSTSSYASKLLYILCISTSFGIFSAPGVGFAAPKAQEGVVSQSQTNKPDFAVIIEKLKSGATNTYNLSVLLYVSSLLKNPELYSETLNQINIQLQNETESSFKAWMLGRVLLAANNMNDQRTINETQFQLKNLLEQKELKKDEFRAWSLGYLAALNLEEYQKNKLEMLAAANGLPGVANRLWSHVMNLQAAARANDRITFRLILAQMKNFTRQANVAEALAQIPVSDWQAWALGIAAESAAIAGDKALYLQLRPKLQAAINTAMKNNSFANAMLAQISSDAADKLMQNR